MRKYKCDCVCELGVYIGGENFMNMIAHQPKVTVAVDSRVDDGIFSHNNSRYMQEELDSQYQYFKNSVQSYPFVKIIRSYTFNAYKKFPDNYFDFVYVDADHSYDACYLDITIWYPKVKPGKFLVGNDYSRGFGVIDAVNKFIKKSKLELHRFSHSNWTVVKK